MKNSKTWVFVAEKRPQIAEPRVIKLRYAHCTKFAPGELDVAPNSAYELREIDVQLVEIAPSPDYPYVTFEVRAMDGRVLASEDCDPSPALGLAAYNLMAMSRYTAGKRGNNAS